MAARLRPLLASPLVIAACTFVPPEASDGPAPSVEIEPVGLPSVDFEAPRARLGITRPGDGRLGGVQTNPPAEPPSPTIDPEPAPEVGPPSDAACGDGIQSATEACDDANRVSQDGCSSVCTVEPGATCLLSSPSFCFASGDAVEVSAARCQDSADGSSARPYCTIGAALADPQVETVLIEPAIYEERVELSGRAVALIAQDGAVLRYADKDVLKIRGGAKVVVRGLTISGIDGYGGGVVVDDDTTGATLIDVSIGPSDQIGLQLKTNADLWMDRVWVARNDKGGLKLESAGRVQITNSVISNNGTATSHQGGVLIKRSPSQGSKFSNNTLVANRASSDVVAGAQCDATGLEIVNSIIWLSSGPEASGVSPACQVRYSNLGASHPGDQNFSTDPVFADASYRVRSSSPCVGAGDPSGVMPFGPAPSWDFDGQLRGPGRPDVGAFEAD